MTEYIKREDALKAIEQERARYLENSGRLDTMAVRGGLGHAFEAVECIPAADVAPVVRLTDEEQMRLCEISVLYERIWNCYTARDRWQAQQEMKDQCESITEFLLDMVEKLQGANTGNSTHSP